MKKMNKGELQSRRDFFKKAAKSALPILGAIVLAGMPNVVKAAETPMGCETTCSGACRDNCHYTCLDTCRGGCNDTCSRTCKGRCTYTCEGSCTNTCEGTCKRSSSRN